MLCYTIFETDWGYLGLAGADAAVSRLVLPREDSASVERELLLLENELKFQQNLLPKLRQQLADFFAGRGCRFDCTLDSSYAGPFGRRVLHECSKIPAGTTITYGELAARAGQPLAARAVGGVMAHNRIPLIIPCHRVVAADGSLRGFSANGGLAMKQRLLDHEAKFPPAAGSRKVPQSLQTLPFS